MYAAGGCITFLPLDKVLTRPSRGMPFLAVSWIKATSGQHFIGAQLLRPLWSKNLQLPEAKFRRPSD